MVAPEALAWQPLVLSRADELRPPAPDATQNAAQLTEVWSWARRRTSSDLLAINVWDEKPPVLRWSALARDEVNARHWPLPRNARALALVHVAMYDTALAVWDAKLAYTRGAPIHLDPSFRGAVVGDGGLPSYPSEHAAIAYAAATVLARLSPTRKDKLLLEAWGAAETRVAGGAALRMDVEAGKALGEAVAARVLQHAEADGSEALAELPLKVQPGQWNADYPDEAVAGSWKTWLGNFPVPDPGASETAPAVSPAQQEIARAWDMGAPAIQWNDIARPLVAKQLLSTPASARKLALMHVAVYDAAIASWKAAYRVLRKRPEGGLLPAPNYPGYPSAVAACAAAAATVLGPSEELDVKVNQATNAGLYGGINYRDDGDQGRVLGEKVGSAALAK
jgi:membrane-associated phospholipid phosphatase